MKAIITILLGVVVTMESASAYPIEPRPLRKLIAESEYIIIGHVIAILKMKKQDDSFDANTIARIRVREVLKGTIRDEIVEVSYDPNYICPAPARYEADTDVVVFLNKSKGRWHTHALSYGVKTLAPADISVFRSRILEMQDILAIGDSYTQFFETVEWLVKCVEHPATRWEGTYELSPKSDFMSFYARSEFKPFQSMLSQEQRDRLKTALFSTDNARYPDLGLVDLVYRGNEAQVHAFLLNTLKELPDNSLFIASEYMERLMQRKSTPKLEQLVEQFSAKRFTTRDDGELKKILQEFVALAEEK